MPEEVIPAGVLEMIKARYQRITCYFQTEYIMKLLNFN